MLHAFFCVNLPLFCKVDKASIIFFLELYAIYRVIVYQILKKLKGEIKYPLLSHCHSRQVRLGYGASQTL